MEAKSKHANQDVQGRENRFLGGKSRYNYNDDEDNDEDNDNECTWDKSNSYPNSLNDSSHLFPTTTASSLVSGLW